ncbi:MAG TPA: ABC transporter substrate-binding protein [Thermoleophilia bacterium]|nr:ABC transporter substrate-binding protein [Thermoleophilia bacterium]
MKLTTIRRAAALLLFAAVATSAAGACGGASQAPAAGASASSGGTAAASPGSASAAASARPEVDQVTLIMDWVPWVLDIPVDVAQARGYYSQNGLTVRQIVPAGATDVVKFVATGKAQFGLYYAPDTLMGVAEGAPLVSVGALMSHAPVGMAFAPGVTATSPKDLQGQVAGVPLIPSTRASFASMLKAGGVPSGSVHVVDPGFDLVAPLLAGKFRAVAVTKFGELVQADAQVGRLSYLDFRDWGTPDYSFLAMISDQEFAISHPATVRAFVRATLEGLAYAAAHPQEAVDLYVTRHPELKKDLLLAQWKAALPSMAVAGEHPAGWQDPASWTALDQWLTKGGVLTKQVDAAAAMTNQYLPAS